MEQVVYNFELIKLTVGGWTLILLRNGHMVGGFVGDDFEDLKLAGDTWLKTHLNKVNDLPEVSDRACLSGQRNWCSK